MIISQRIIEKLRAEYLSVVSPIIEQASTISLVQRWNALFQCSIAPKPEWIAPEVMASMLDVYHVASVEELLPKYLGNAEQWGAVVSPRIATTTGKPIAFIEHWFVTEPSDLEQVVDAVKTQWPFFCEAIWIPISPRHRCAPLVKAWNSIHVQEYAYVANLSRNHAVEISNQFSQYSISTNQDVNSWWPVMYGELIREGKGRMSEDEMTSLKIGMKSSLITGGILNLNDSVGLAAHISCSHGSDAELLIPQCWNVPFVFVRDDLRGQGLAKYLYLLASQIMNFEDISLVCARVQAENQPSWKVLEAIGAEREMELYCVGSITRH